MALALSARLAVTPEPGKTTTPKGEQAAQLIEDLKKADMAREAERLLHGSGWLPEPLRVQGGDASQSGSRRKADTESLPAFLADDADAEPRPVAAE